MSDEGELEIYESPRDEPDRILRALAGAVPWVGSAIGEALTVKYAEARERRLKEAFDTLGDVVRGLGNVKLDKAYIASEEFQQLLIACIENIQRESREEKRRAFVNIIANAMIRRLFSERTRAEWYAGVLGRQSYFHLLVLQEVDGTDIEREAILSHFTDRGDRQALLGCAKDLTGAGFITEFDLPHAEVNELETLRQLFRTVQLTANGAEYVKWLSRPQA